MGRQKEKMESRQAERRVRRINGRGKWKGKKGASLSFSSFPLTSTDTTGRFAAFHCGKLRSDKSFF